MTNALATITDVREELAPMKAEFGMVLPSHITPDKFAQVCITAIENNPALLQADRQSFKVACLNAANDGLLPDKREGAFVIFNTEVDVRREGSNATFKEKRAIVQYMPMITGVLKKAYQTGKITSIAVELVHKNDVYRRAAGDDAVIVHEPLDFGDRGPVIGGYAIVVMKDGGVYREVVSLEQIEKVRNVSKTKDRGPWVAFWEEMAKKTILRRTLKRVPLSAEMDQVLARDDVFYNLDAERRPLLEGPARRAVPNKALFSDVRHEEPASDEPDETAADGPAADEGRGEAAQRPVASPENEAPVEGGGKPQDEEEIVIDDPAYLQRARFRIEACDDIDEFGETVDAVFEGADRRMSPDARAKMDGVAGTHGQLLSEGPLLRAWTTSTQKEPKVYQDGRLWSEAILEKLDAIKGHKEALGAFWAKNRDLIIRASKYDVGAVKRVTDAAGKHGLTLESN